MIKRVNNLEKLEKMLQDCENTDINNVNREKVKDIKDVKINKKKSSIERILDFLHSTDNPYVIKVNGVIVKMEFSNNSKVTANKCINKALKELYLKNC